MHASPGDESQAVPPGAGPRSLTAHLVEWEAPAGMSNDGETAKDDGHPDFVVLVNPADHTADHRTEVETFDPPSTAN